MGLPGQFLYTVLDVSVRCECTQAQIINWAIAGDLMLVAAITTATIGGEVTGGLHQIAASDVRPLFRPHGRADEEVRLKRARKIGGDQCLIVSEPSDGVVITAADVLITAEEVERFEEAHGIGRSRGRGNAGPGYRPATTGTGSMWPCSSGSTLTDSRRSSGNWCWKCRNGSSPTRRPEKP